MYAARCTNIIIYDEMSSFRRWLDTARVMDGMQVAGYYMHTNSAESRINFEFSQP